MSWAASCAKNYADVITKRYAEFDGRASLSEFWLFILVHLLITGVFVAVGFLLSAISDNAVIGCVILYVIYYLAITIPCVALQVRRLHDTGRSGWWWFLGFIPYLGAFILFILWAGRSQPESNEWGAHPNA